MLVDFEKLSLVSRVWIYQSNRSFTDDEINKINLQISDFLKSWTAHGNDLQAAFLIKYKRFIILSIDIMGNSDILYTAPSFEDLSAQ